MTEIAPDVQFSADGEDLAEGGVEAFLAGLARPLEALGVTLHVETVSAAETGTYAVSINGDAVFLYDENSWHAVSVDDNPWFASTVRPLAALNRLLGQVGAVERFFTLYTGANEGLALLIDPAVVAELVRSGVGRKRERPIEAS